MKVSLADINRVVRRTKSGTKVYYYHRKTGKRIEGEPGSPEFARNYELASQASHEPVSPQGTFAELLKTYAASPEFRKLAKKTRITYNQRIGVMVNSFGALSLRALSEKKIRGVILEWRDQIATKYPSGAEGYIATLKAILSFAEERALIDINPLRGVKRVHHVSRADCVWSQEQITRLLSVSPNLLQWAIKLALFTGQRKGDLIRLRWDDVKGDYLRFTQSKTKSKVSIRIIPPLQALLDTIPRRADTILTNKSGRQWSDVSGLTALWLRAMNEAGLTDANLRFHDLRGTAVTCLADVGCTESEIASITGHSLMSVSQMLQTHYLRRTDAQSSAAMGKLGTSWIGQLQN